jgi:hypothetical protein
MSARQYQQTALRALSNYFDDVRTEWAVTKGASDALRFGVTYAPRVDIAVGPFNTVENDSHARRQEILTFATHPIIKRIVGRERKVRFNRNPRCVLAVEIEFSGSSKHILGDFTNASMMGLVGVVIVPPSNFEKALRIYRYVEFIRNVHKAPVELFRNLVLFETDEFLGLLD